MKKQRTINTRFLYPLVMLLSAFGVQQISAATVGVQTATNGGALTSANLLNADHKHAISGIVAADLDATVQSKILSTYAAGEQLSITGITNSAGATPIPAFSYFLPSSVILWQDKTKWGKWQCLLASEPHIDMHGGTLVLETDIILKGDGRFDSLGTIKTDSTFFSTSRSERSISLSEYETVFPRGIAGFVDVNGSDQTRIPTGNSFAVSTTSQIPVSCDWTDPFPDEYIFSVTNGGGSALGKIWATQVTVPIGVLTLTEKQSVSSASNAEGKYTCVRVFPFVDREKGDMMIAVSRLAPGSGKNGLQLYRYNAANGGGLGTFYSSDLSYSGSWLNTPDVFVRTNSTPSNLFNNMDVYAIGWRPNFGSPSNGSVNNGPTVGGGAPQLAITYKYIKPAGSTDADDGNYFLGIFELFYNGQTLSFELRERGRAQLRCIGTDGAFIASSGQPIANQLSWKNDGNRLVIVAKDANADQLLNNIQVFDVLPDGRIAVEPELEVASGVTRPKMINGMPSMKPRIVYAISPTATTAAWNPTNDLIASTSAQSSNAVRIYKITRGVLDQFGASRDTLGTPIQGSNITIAQVSMSLPTKDAHWDSRGMTLAVACMYDSTSANAKRDSGGVRLYTITRDGVIPPTAGTLYNPLEDANDDSTNRIGFGSDLQGDCYTVRYNRFGDKFARGSSLTTNSVFKLGAHLLPIAGGFGQEASFENIALILNSDIDFNAAVKVAVGSRLIIKGNGHTMTFTDQGRIMVPSNSTLYLKDVTVRGIKSRDQSNIYKISGADQSAIQEYSVINSINLIDSVDNSNVVTRANLVLENSTLIPDISGAQFVQGKISFVGSNAVLGGDGKTLGYKKPDSSGYNGVTIEQGVSKFSGKANVQGTADFGKSFTMQGDMDFRGAGFLNPISIDGGGHEIQMNTRSFPSTTTINMERNSLIPASLFPTGGDAFAKKVDAIDTTNDVDNPIICLAHKGDGASDSGRVTFGIINPITQLFVKGVDISSGSLTGVDGQVSDVSFRKIAPIEIVDPNDAAIKYDRYFIALLRTGSPTLNAGIQIYALNIKQAFYTSATPNGIYDSVPTSAGYASFGTGANYVTVTAPGTGSGSLIVPTDAQIKFAANEQARAMAMHPQGKELAVVVDINTNGTHTYEIRIYQIRDTGALVTESTKVFKAACGKPSSKIRPLRWTANGKSLLLSVNVDDINGKLQIFVRKDTSLENSTDFVLTYIPLIAPHPYDNKIIAVSEDNAPIGSRRGIKIFSLDDLGKAQENQNSVASINGISFNNLEWNPDGNMLMSATSDGVKQITFNLTESSFLGVISGEAARMDKGGSVANLKFTPNGTTLIRHGYSTPGSFATHTVMIQILPSKDRAGLSNATMNMQSDFALAAKMDVTSNSEINMNKKVFDFPSTGEVKIASGTTLTLSKARIRGVKTRRKAIDAGNGTKQMVNEIANIKFADSTAKLVLNECEMELHNDASFVSTGKIEIKTKDLQVTGASLDIPAAGLTKIASSDGFTMVADSSSQAAVTIATGNNLIDTTKQISSTTTTTTTIRNEAALGAATAKSFAQGQKRENNFERPVDGIRKPLILQGSADSTVPVKMPMQAFMELSGSGQGDITVQGYMQLDGPTNQPDGTTADLTDNTVLKVSDGAKLVVKAGGSLTCTGQMSIVADKGGSVVVQNGASIVLGTADTKTNDKVGLIGNGGEIELQGSTAQIASSYGQNKIVMNPGSSIDATAGGEILINQTLTGVVTSGVGANSRLTEFTLDKAKIAGPANTNDPIIYIAPNDTVGGAEVSTTLAVANVQNTGNTNMAFTKANANAALPGTDAKAATLNDFDQAGSLKVAQLVENLTVDNKVKSGQVLNPVRTDAQDIPQVTSIIDPLFKYDVRASDKLNTIKRGTSFSGQEMITGTDQFGHAFSQVKDGQRIS